MKINQKNAASQQHGYWDEWLKLYQLHFNNGNSVGLYIGKRSSHHYAGYKNKKIGYRILNRYVNEHSTLVVQQLYNKSGKLFGERILWKRIE